MSLAGKRVLIKHDGLPLISAGFATSGSTSCLSPRIGLCGVSNFRKYITVHLSRLKEQLHSELISQEQSHVVHFLLVDDPFHITHICTTYLAISFFSASCVLLI